MLGGIGNILGSIGGPALLAALGIGAIGAAITGYIASPEFRKFVNDYILIPLGNVLTKTIPALLDRMMNPNRYKPITEDVNISRDSAEKARNQYRAGKYSKMIQNKAMGKLEEGEEERVTNTMNQLERTLRVTDDIERLKKDIKFQRSNITETQKQIEKEASQGNTWVVKQLQQTLKRLTEEQIKREDDLAKQEKFLRDYIEKNQDLTRVLGRWIKGQDVIKQQTDNPEVVSKYANGGPITVPGSGSGDKVPAVLPEGSFVLNRNAAGFQNGGLVPALLEPGEQVYGPGSWGMREMILNSAMPRFQSGGFVGASRDQMTDTGLKDKKGRPVLLAPAAASAFKKMIDDGMPYNPGDVYNVWRNEAEYKRLKNAGYNPASNSHHNHGEAADIHGATGAWIRANGAKYGWVPNDYSGSHGGHYEFKGPGAGLRGKATRDETKIDDSGGTKGSGIDMLQGVGGWIGDFMRGIGDGLSEAFGDSGLGDIFKNLMSGGKKTGGSSGGGGGGGGGHSTPGGTGPVDMGKDINEKLMNTAKLAMEAGFTKEQAKVMAAIAGGESTFNNRALNNNRASGDKSYGLWQINMIDEMGPARRKALGISSNEELYDPATNARAAKYIFDRQGYTAWGAYKDGNAAKYMNAAQALKLQNGGLVNMSGYKGGSAISQRSEDQFIEKMAAAVTPVVIPVPTGGGGTGASDVSVSKGVQDVPSLPAYPDNTMALDLANRLSLGAAFA
jgi:hypothetical protein